MTEDERRLLRELEREQDRAHHLAFRGYFDYSPPITPSDLAKAVLKAEAERSRAGKNPKHYKNRRPRLVTFTAAGDGAADPDR
jgi:hypothetical protein